jgi:hypothetical protein
MTDEISLEDQIARDQQELLSRAKDAERLLPALLNSEAYLFIEGMLKHQLERLEHQVVYADDEWLAENGKTREGVRLEAIGIKIALQLPRDQLEYYEKLLEVERNSDGEI